jgi:hypothetical protein
LILCSANKRIHNLAFITGLALQHDGGPFGLRKTTASVLEKAEDHTSAFLFARILPVILERITS